MICVVAKWYRAGYTPPMSRMVDAIRRAVRESGRSQYELAEASGVSRPQLSRLMTGERGLSAANLEALADALGLEFELRPKRQRRKGR
jgi:transcriptional regulator with XRE-family HTH domain